MVDISGEISLYASCGFDSHPGANASRAVADDILDAFLVVDDAQSIATGAILTTGVFFLQNCRYEPLYFLGIHLYYVLSE